MRLEKKHHLPDWRSPVPFSDSLLMAGSPHVVLVTGGAGFIGSHLVRLLLGRGADVRVLEHPRAAIEHLPLDRVDLVRADIRDRQAVDRAVRGCSEVYHLAANPNLWTQQRGRFRKVNYTGTVNVLEAALEAGCHVFCEKPSCVRAADFARLVRKAQQKHRHLMLALANRTHAPVKEARRLVRDGKLGKLYAVEAHLVADQSHV